MASRGDRAVKQQAPSLYVHDLLVAGPMHMQTVPQCLDMYLHQLVAVLAVIHRLAVIVRLGPDVSIDNDHARLRQSMPISGCAI